MTTQTIGIKEFRQNMAKLCKKARKENIHFIVMNHQVPMMRMSPIDEDQLILEKYADQIDRGMTEFERGESYSLKKVMDNIRRRKK